MKHEHISTLEVEHRMNHDVNKFHTAQLKENKYMQMVRDVCTRVEIITQEKDQVQILEFGAGSGILSLLIVEQVVKLSKKGKDITFIISEPDTELLKFASNYIAQNVSDSKLFKDLINKSKIRFVEMKIQDVEKLDSFFDVIVSTEVFHHIPYEIKEDCVVKVNSVLNEEGVLIIGDNFVADQYNYKSKSGLIVDRKKIAPQVAKLLKDFWNNLFQGQNWPESFNKAYIQQQEGLIECKTSLPHLIEIITKNGGVVKDLYCYDQSISENGGYAIIEVN